MASLFETRHSILVATKPTFLVVRNNNLPALPRAVPYSYCCRVQVRDLAVHLFLDLPAVYPARHSGGHHKGPPRRLAYRSGGAAGHGVEGREPRRRGCVHQGTSSPTQVQV